MSCAWRFNFLIPLLLNWFLLESNQANTICTEYCFVCLCLFYLSLDKLKRENLILDFKCLPLYFFWLSCMWTLWKILFVICRLRIFTSISTPVWSILLLEQYSIAAFVFTFCTCWRTPLSFFQEISFFYNSFFCDLICSHWTCVYCKDLFYFKMYLHTFCFLVTIVVSEQSCIHNS